MTHKHHTTQYTPHEQHEQHTTYQTTMLLHSPTISKFKQNKTKQKHTQQYNLSPTTGLREYPHHRQYAN
jgi:hypothetical protein